MLLAEIQLVYKMHSLQVLVRVHEHLGPGLELPVVIRLPQRLPALVQGRPLAERLVELLWMPAELKHVDALSAAIRLWLLERAHGHL